MNLKLFNLIICRKTIYCIHRLIIIAAFFTLNVSTQANWIMKENKNSFIQKEISTQQTSYTPNTQHTQHSKSDSLPQGFTDEVMKNLRDENGNKIIPDEEGDAMQQRTFNGVAAADIYGNSVSSAGDVNGDGYDDIIIGAPQNDAGGNDAGRAYIYYGGIIMNNTVDVILTGEAADSDFGNFVSAAGDVNSDGYSDVIAGAPGYNTITGRAYIYYGGPVMNNTADVIMTGESVNNSFGYAVSTAGDVNGDGYSDVIVGAHQYSSFTGRAYIFYGGSLMNNVADVTMTGGAANDVLGRSVSTAGDVNGDGYSDAIVSAAGYSTNTGRVYVFYGGSAVNNVADVVMTGETINNGFGISVSTAGDLNGDGYSDVIAGAYLYNTNTGRAYVFYGGASMNNTADVTMTGETTNNNFGHSVSTVGDVNGDGYSDVVVGAYRYNSFTGRAYIYYGGSVMNNTADIIQTGEAINDKLGYSVSTAGDVNVDGYSDVIAGANGYNINTGRGYVYTNTMTGEDIPDISMTGESANSQFGGSVSGAGDVNGDGYSDVIVGAESYSSNTGRAYIFYGGSLINNVADVTITGEATSNYLGQSVSTAGDVNGDGYSDVIVGAYGNNSYIGRAYIFYGGSSMNNVADVIMTGEATNNLFGFSVSIAGDVNGDGYSDVVVGAYGYSSSTGRAYVFYGGSSMNNVSDVIITGEATSNGLGRSVSSAGDVNGDGYSDVITGASNYGTSTGRAYIYYGGSSMNNFADIVMTGEGTSNGFGIPVSSAGDINGDGYSDVIVSAQLYGTSTGKVYVFFGGPIMNNVADVSMTGEGTNNYFGFSVSGADVNGDEYSDVIIGAPSYSSSTGRAYIFFGSSSMNNDVDITMMGETPGSNFGTSVSSAGDVNGDGYTDVIVGGIQYMIGPGRAYVYMSSPPNVKPVIISVKDVPFDQGGKVNLRWMKSGYDTRIGGTITGYLIERSSPTGSGGFFWQNITTVPAVHNTQYEYAASTPNDSMNNNSGVYFFRITAQTSDPGQYWYSNILSGYSIDNIAPPAPLNLTGEPITGAVLLNWSASIVPDFQDFVIYRNGIEIGSATNLNYIDNTVTPDSIYTYKVSSRDINGNLSAQSNPAVITFNISTINIKAIPEGFYNAAANRLNRKDTLRAYLHNVNPPFSIVDSSKAVIDSVTFNGIFKFPNALNGTYYIVVKHRNTIETWSKSGGEVITIGTTMNYDFTINAIQSFGNNMKQIDATPVRYGVYSGDVSHDGYIDLNDISLVSNATGIFLTGYAVSDVTGDNIVDLNDLTITYNNSSAFVSVIMP